MPNRRNSRLTLMHSIETTFLSINRRQLKNNPTINKNMHDREQNKKKEFDHKIDGMTLDEIPGQSIFFFLKKKKESKRS